MDLGVIKSIGEISDPLEWYGYSGYKVETDKHCFVVLIQNGYLCCEKWGYLACDDDLVLYVGTSLRDIILFGSDTRLSVDGFGSDTRLSVDGYGLPEDAEYQFVDFVTELGPFQLAVYNAHNGYYGHMILVAKDGVSLMQRKI